MACPVEVPGGPVGVPEGPVVEEALAEVEDHGKFGEGLAGLEDFET